MTAVILAGCRGTGLDPFTRHSPLALVPVANRPLIDYQLELLRRHGITRALVALAHLGRRIQRYLGKGSRHGLQLDYRTDMVYGPETVFGPLQVPGTVLLLPGDVLTDLDLAALLDYHRLTRAQLTVVAAGLPTGRRQVAAPVPPAEGLTGGAGAGPTGPGPVSAGVYVFGREALGLVSAEVALSVEHDIIPMALGAGMRVRSYLHRGYWRRLVTLDSYLAASCEVLLGQLPGGLPGGECRPGLCVDALAMVDRDVSCLGMVVVGRGAAVASGARLGPAAVLGPGVRIGPRARLSYSVVGPGAEVGRGAVVCSSLVAPGARVRPGQVVIGSLVLCNGLRPLRGRP